MSCVVWLEMKYPPSLWMPKEIAILHLRAKIKNQKVHILNKSEFKYVSKDIIKEYINYDGSLIRTNYDHVNSDECTLLLLPHGFYSIKLSLA